VDELLHGRGAGLVLGQYSLLEPLGGGGMGQVFKAWHRLMRRTVALKVMRDDLLSRPEALQRFRREIELAAQLRHPHIVTAYDAELVGRRHCLVMEYCEGKTLAELVRQVGHLAVDQACTYIHHATLGLQHAHERSMIHRDIKPENLLLTQGTVKILDFGLARLRDPLAPESNLTRLGTVMGTPDFMAPEQAQGLHAADARSDLYSLGCTFYFLLAGRVPFLGGNAAEKLLRQQAEEPPPLERVRVDVPPQVQAIVKLLMAKEPARRYQTAADVAAVLEPLAQFVTPSTDCTALAPTATPGDGWSNGEVATFRAPAPVKAAVDVRPAPPHEGRRRRWLFFAGLPLLVLLGGALTLWLRSSPTPPPPVVPGGVEPGGVEPEPAFTSRPWRWQLAFKETLGFAQVRALALSADGQWLALAQGNRAQPDQAGEVTLWRVERSALALRKKWRTKTVGNAVAFSPDNQLLAWGVAEAPTITIWDIANEAETHIEGHLRGTGSLMFSPDGALLLAGTFQGSLNKSAIGIWDVRSRKWLEELTQKRGRVNALAFSADGQLLAAAIGTEKYVRLLDFPTRTERRLEGRSLPGQINALALSADGKTVAVAIDRGFANPRTDPAIKLWDVPTGAPHAKLLFEGDAEVHALAFTPDGARLLAAHEDNVTRVYRLDSYQEESTLAAHEKAVHGLGISRDGAVVATAGGDRTVCVWRRAAK
jgi:WD40 repeat protein